MKNIEINTMDILDCNNILKSERTKKIRVLTCGGDNTAKLWDTHSGEVIQTYVGHIGFISSCAISSYGYQILTGSQDKTAKLWDVKTGECIRTFEGHSGLINVVAFSPDSSMVLTCSEDETVKLWDINTRKIIHSSLIHSHLVLSVLFSLDGTKVLLGSEDNTIKLLDINTGQFICSVSGRLKCVPSMKFSSDGMMVLTGSYDKTAILWNRRNDHIRTFFGHDNWISSVALSYDESQVLTGSEDKTAKLWDVKTGTEICSFIGHQDIITSVAFSYDGSMILTGSGDKTAKLWDVKTGQEIVTLSDHNDVILCVSFFPPEYKKVPSKFLCIFDLHCKHRIDEPLQWSVLNKTIPDLFNIPEDMLSHLWNIFGCHNLSIIELSRREWDNIAQKCVYPDDSLEFLLSGSISYLISIFDNRIFNYILSRFPDFAHNLAGVSLPPLSFDVVSKQPVVNEIDIHLLRNYFPKSFSLSELAIYIVRHQKIVSWNDFLSISEKSLLESCGINHFSFQLIRELWRIKLYAQKATVQISGFPFECFINFKVMLKSFIHLVVKTPRDKTILLGRMGLLEGRNWTLDELSSSLGVTRERIRQLELRMLKPHIVGLLSRLWFAVDEIMYLTGGACLISDLAEQVALKMEWKKKPSVKELLAVLYLHDSVKIDKDVDLVYDPRQKCFDCELVVSALEDLFSKDITNQSLPHVIKYLSSTCFQKYKCNNYSISKKFSEGFIRLVVNKTNSLLIKDGVINSIRGSRVKLVERVLKNVERPMHFSEVYKKLRSLLPEEDMFTERNVHQWLTNAKNLLLWDRGTFVHCEYVNVPPELLKDIECWLIDKLGNNIPFFSVAGAYDKFINRCKQVGIESESALYTCLKRSNNPQLIYPHYPQIYLKDSFESRIPAVVVIEQYIKEVGKEISFDALRNHAIYDIGLKEFQFNQCMSRINNVIRKRKRTYIHTDFLAIDQEKLLLVINYIKDILKKHKHISIKKIFNDKRISCIMMGIEGPEMLYSILKLATSDNIIFDNYPIVRLWEKKLSNAIGKGVISKVVAYIQQKNALCSFDELDNLFIKKLGYDEQIIYSAVNDNNIIRFSQGTLLHIDVIEWTNDKRLQVENIAQDTIILAHKVGKCYALISDIIEHSSLPKLSNGIIWSQTLLSELLVRNKTFRTLGNAKNAFVLLPNEHGIESFEDLVYEILRKDHDGASNLNSFQENLRKSGIIQKKLTPSMLGDQKKVSISGQIILLRELLDHA